LVRICFNRRKVIGMVRKGYRLSTDLCSKPLCVGIISGFLCVLVDLDHPVAVAVGIADSRFAHPWYFLVSCIIIIGCCTFVGRLLYKAFLRKGYA